MMLGAGRNRAEDRVDHAVGVVVRAPVGERVKAGDAVLEVHYRDEATLGGGTTPLARGGDRRGRTADGRGLDPGRSPSGERRRVSDPVLTRPRHRVAHATPLAGATSTRTTRAVAAVPVAHSATGRSRCTARTVGMSSALSRSSPALTTRNLTAGRHLPVHHQELQHDRPAAGWPGSTSRPSRPATGPRRARRTGLAGTFPEGRRPSARCTGPAPRAGDTRGPRPRPGSACCRVKQGPLAERRGWRPEVPAASPRAKR